MIVLVLSLVRPNSGRYDASDLCFMVASRLKASLLEPRHDLGAGEGLYALQFGAVVVALGEIMIDAVGEIVLSFHDECLFSDFTQVR